MRQDRRPSRALLPLALLLVAANLRPAAASVGPLIHRIRDDSGLSSAEAGILVTLPALCFGALAPVAPVLARRLGLFHAVAAALTALLAGLLLRLLHPIAALYAGTALAGAGIASGNVLIPVIVKRSFSGSVGVMSGAYVTTLIASASVAAGATVPLTHALGLGWRGGLGLWALPAGLALAVWLTQLHRHEERSAPPASRAGTRALLRDPLAWQLAVFFGMQSCGFYSVLSWLPSIFQSHGVDSTRAGLLLGVCMIVGLPAALLVPTFAARIPRQGALAAGFSLVIFAGFLGLLLAPASGAWLWAVLIGIGQGACFPLALTLIVLRSADAVQTASLSTLVQTAGYLIAAAGPPVVGALHDATGSWSPAIVLLLALTAPQVAAGIGAGRNRHVAGARAADA
jgi:CP family cyanate transporter-like MFS transporter